MSPPSPLGGCTGTGNMPWMQGILDWIELYIVGIVLSH